ncbi:pyruvate dehydrogenase (acetyl-transferring), homodimeric type [Acanthopleuribacter pedis]|uniref:Pyruvate dehydrogenase E1 component n=1 Tax=Acanthopleuribacter pedis TaxID=442870 RepID=A0A8J7QPG7_9BACT|nr:pyruvate dehydrogenase (acetyl-transferring), homodimeric type [Acanthopleuribacter pedis]MBO1321715.1 pyruvate dehydrogenase (acetyl-transferring), homodimeric type [Acanthopleuribacter pedis]
MPFTANPNDIDPEETREWEESLQAVLDQDGPERAHFLLETLIDRARRRGAHLPYKATTAYVNTIPPHMEAKLPGDAAMEKRIRDIIRWNAMAIVVGANRAEDGLGGHIASFASSATLYDVGFNYFWHAPTEEHGGDMVFIQGHSSPGIYARAYLEGRLSEDDLRRFRQEVKPGGLSSYPHPWLMPGFWQFPTVSMGLGPIMAIYQARFMQYMRNRGLIQSEGRKVWAFMGDGEMDEPESLGAISLAGREKLDNLIFVVNCNLQRLDGPVRGNGSIIQELEGVFRGAGWNVLKVIWGSNWDPLLAKDQTGLLARRMEEAVDGEYQAYKASGSGAYVRKHFFGKYPELEEMVAKMSDEQIWDLTRGGHDPHKVYAAYAAAMQSDGRPTVILAKTVKGYGMGEAGEGQNISHQQKKMGEHALRQYRDNNHIPVSDADLEKTPFYKPEEDSEEIKYLKARREALGGYLPKRNTEAPKLPIPELGAFKTLLQGSGKRDISTTMAFVRFLTVLTRDKNLKQHLVPIIPDEARTFGMEGMFRQLGIYSPFGQLYTPVDEGQIAPYIEKTDGQILEEGINEAGATSSWIAAGTAYANHGVPMIPFYIFYSMFGFQRVGDLIWAAGDMQARGFLIGGTSGRTTLNGEGLQHQDGHSHLQAATVPNCVSYDPTYSFELAVILQDGLRRMYAEQENVFYYVTTMNENYHHPAMPEGAEEGIRKGIYRLKQGGEGSLRAALLGSGTILREAEQAAEILATHYSVATDIYSVTSYNELRRDGLACERWNRLHPEAEAKVPYLAQVLAGFEGPVISATDYMKSYSDQIRPFVQQPFVALGTDGFGRSDTRRALRDHFEVDHRHIVVATLKALADNDKIEPSRVSDAIQQFGIDPDTPDPQYA